MTLLIVGATLGYGVLRRGQAQFTAGPRVALIQGNFVASLRQRQPTPETMYLTHARLTGLAVREQPDLIVWPEGMFPAPLLDAAPGMTEEMLAEKFPNVDPTVWMNPRIKRDLGNESQKAGAALMWGLHSMRAEPQGVAQANSAAFATPDRGYVGKYDKRHLVPFGEYMPLRDLLPFLSALTPYSGGYAGLVSGTEPTLFDYKTWRFAPIICYEDTVPHVVRASAAAALASEAPKKVDVLVNMSNDGWFHGSSELDQHLIIAAFRAVECRTPMVRAVNTGISAIIDGDGAILEPDVFIDGEWKKDSTKPPRKSTRDPATGKRYRQMLAALVHTVPLDNRGSLYVRFGDWFAGTCYCAVIAVMVLAIMQRFRGKNPGSGLA
jgi:apolipoprotein N-acyltransferase